MFKYYFLFLFVFTLLFSSCQGESKQADSANVEAVTSTPSIENVVIEDLKTDAQISKFLADLFYIDQHYRDQSPQVEKDFGRNSPEHKAHYKKMNEADNICLVKAKQFLDVHGFPDPNRHGSDAYQGILYVFHHSPSNNVDRHEYLPIFYQAYQEGKLDESRFDFYLGRMYDYECGKRMEMESPFKPADRIAKYIEAFNFKPN